MSSHAASPTLVSPEEYLARERQAEVKSEYFDGEVVAFAGASERHNLIVANLVYTLLGQLRDGPCRVYPSDLRVWNPLRRTYTYPDVTVVRGERRFADDQRDVLLNPTLLVEVLSESTEKRDRGIKSEQYRRIESLSTYLLVSQDSPRAELYRRYGELQWMLTEALGITDVLELDSVDCTLALRDIYYNVLDPGSSEHANSTDHG